MKTHILGFPRIGKHRELKKALEDFWKGDISSAALCSTANALKRRHWQVQKDAGLSFVATGDFSLYDQMLDTSLMLGATPARFAGHWPSPLERYFSLARGHAGRNIAALEMTKWFDTNYHYLVPEIDATGPWTPSTPTVVEDTRLAAESGFTPKPVLIGPFTWLALAKAQGGSHKWLRLPQIQETYARVLSALAAHAPLIQIDEPVLCTDLLSDRERALFAPTYAALNAACQGRLMLTTYFGELGENLPCALHSGCAALHVDLTRGQTQLGAVLDGLPQGTALSLGLVNGRNIWKNRTPHALDLIQRAVRTLGEERVLLASSCSLLHVPTDIAEETALPAHIKERMAFAVQKCVEVAHLGRMAQQNAIHREDIPTPHADTHIPAVRQRMAAITPDMLRRRSPYAQRRAAQSHLELPLFPTTTIGSFPQTEEIRRIRQERKKGSLTAEEYATAIQRHIAQCIHEQEHLQLDVLVHGEAERNDMVEYFGQQLGGFCFTRNGWVQSYGSRCVKPPVIYGDVYRKAPMTLEWTRYAQSLTAKPVKGMLTGPVTILCWSFVRDDLERREVCRQIALAVRDEVLDLERAGVRIIQIDEAALREGMPLTAAAAQDYLRWAVDAFLLASAGVEDRTQIHTHMCYSEFNASLPWIARMDADVISIESSRSGMDLLDAFASFHYPAGVGPGVYDIHSPRVPSEAEMLDLLHRALRHIPKERLWVNPDCGLKTRRWEEALPSLANMAAATLRLRAEYAGQAPSAQDAPL